MKPNWKAYHQTTQPGSRRRHASGGEKRAAAVPKSRSLLSGMRVDSTILNPMETEAVYQETLNYLYSFVDYSLTRGFRNLPEQFDLNRMAEFMASLGNPHRSYPVIHVAGTKGKGSVCALCSAALKAAGYRVGLYTSPHLEDYTERIRINGESILPAELVDLVNEFRPVLDRGTKLTTFEITTALAFLYFARQGATAVVAEVGLGGRLDATNVVTPVVSAITSISYDHMQVLGNTLAEIAVEKAGIIKPGIPVVVSPQLAEARQAIETIADERRAPLVQVGRDYEYELISHSIDSQTFKIRRSEPGPDGREAAETVSLSIPLLGRHQVENAATAYAVLQTASNRGLEADAPSIRDGFAGVNWPGRFEILQRDPPVIVDSAHNRDSAEKLRQTLQDYFPGREIILVFGASEDKDIEGMLATLAPIARKLIFTRSFHPRAAEPEDLADLAAPYGKPMQIVQKVEYAVDAALRDVDENSLVLAAGSIFIAAAVRQTLLERSNAQE